MHASLIYLVLLLTEFERSE